MAIKQGNRTGNRDKPNPIQQIHRPNITRQWLFGDLKMQTFKNRIQSAHF